jgi:hypothetical protein
MPIAKSVQTAITLMLAMILFSGFVFFAILGASSVTGELSSADDQKVQNGDYILYDVTVNGDVGTLRFDYSSVTSTQVAVQVTSTIWYFSSLTYTADIYYNENGDIKLPGVTDEFIDSNKIGETTIQTAYGLKNVTIFSFWFQGTYSDILRTYYVPLGCEVYYSYNGEDTTGNHIAISLAETNIEWLRNVGAATGESTDQGTGSDYMLWLMVIGGIAVGGLLIAAFIVSKRRSNEMYNPEARLGPVVSSPQQLSSWTCHNCYSRNAPDFIFCFNCGARKK